MTARKLKPSSAADIAAWVRSVCYHDKWKRNQLEYTLGGGALKDILNQYAHAQKMLAKHGLNENGKPKK